MKYRGNGLPPGNKKISRHFYRADKDEGLVNAVNIALELGHPLLVKGPPGCGKTKLAESIAHELGIPESNRFEWYIKSTSRARDGIYMIDMVRRLQDAQMRGKQAQRAQRLTNYIRFGPLGKALRCETLSILLIDEIDKADIDFPNDLLRELDKMEFEIEELDESDLTTVERRAGWRKLYKAKYRPIIVITSNDEKELSDAFLRRCLFYYIDFPEISRLEEIIEANLPNLALDKLLVKNAVAQLVKLRGLSDLRKSPATSELIDWVRILHQWGVTAEQLAENRRLTDLPYLQALFKHERDVNRVREYNKEKANQ